MQIQNTGPRLSFLMLLIESNFMEGIKNSLRSNRKAIVWSLINAIVLFLLCYFIDNSPYSFVGDATVGQHIEQLKLYFQKPNDTIPSDLLLINVAYDRQLVDINDEFGFPKGNIDITDRSKLLELLKHLKESQYKYIILDVVFSEEYETSEDSTLFSLIASMPNIVIPKSQDIILADSHLIDKARYSDYSIHIAENNFVKYEFIKNNENTLPYKVYIDLYRDSIHAWEPFYFFNGKLANKSVVLRHPIKLWNKYKEITNNSQIAESKYYNLGSDIIDINLDLEKFAYNKIVIIGDFTEKDIHDTYLGKISGPIININAFYALKNDDLSIPYWYIIFILILYMTISFCIIKRFSISRHILWIGKVKSKVIRYLSASIGITAILTIVAVILYICFNLECNILIPSIYFSILLAIVKFKDNNF